MSNLVNNSKKDYNFVLDYLEQEQALEQVQVLELEKVMEQE